MRGYTLSPFLRSPFGSYFNVISPLGTVHLEFVERLPVSEHHPRCLSVSDDDSTAASGTREPFLSSDLETAVRAPNILVSSRNEDRLPNTNMLSGTARVPLGHRHSRHSESPSRFLLPLVHVLGSVFACLVEEAPLAFLIERGGDRLVPMNGLAADRTILHKSRR